MTIKDSKQSKKLGMKIVAGVLVVGLSVGAPISVYADEEATTVAEEQAPEQVEKLQAKKVDGSDELVDISDKVLEMLEKEEIELNKKTKYLEDVETGQKVDPETGERVDKIPELPPEEKPEVKPTPEEKPEVDGEVPPEAETKPDENAPAPETGEAVPTSPTENTEVQPQPSVPAPSKPEIDAAKQEAAKDPNAAKTNAELVNRQQIVKAPEIIEDYRFWTVVRKYAFAKTPIVIREEMPSDVDGHAETSKDAVKKDTEAAKKEAKAIEQRFTEAEQTPPGNIKPLRDIWKGDGRSVQSSHKKIAPLFFDLEQKVKELGAVKQAQIAAAEAAAMAPAPQPLTSEVGRPAGQIAQDGLMYVLKEENNGWLYVESGNVRGFVKASEVYRDKAAQEILNVYQTQAKKTAKENGKKYTGIEGTAETALPLVTPKDNKAYTHLRATVNQTVVPKKYAVCNADYIPILEQKQEGTKVIGDMNKGSLCYVLENKDSKWAFVESGDVRGFVDRQYLDTGDKITKQVKAAGEENYALANEKVKPKQNEAFYHTLTSTKAGVPGGEVRQSIIEFASQFIGNPYVWGGTSLTNGADCSGFVQQIYKAYGYNLPRVADDQSQYGTKIPVKDAQPGDLIFYAENGYVYHVVMYAGDDKTIEAANGDVGIINGEVNHADAVWATRILDDNYSLAGGDINSVNATPDMYGQKLGNFTITHYCACEICCNKTDGITATGTPVVEGRTIAVDPNVIPYGTQVIINGHVFTAEDCGGAIKKNHIDIYVDSHEEALALGVKNADVYLVK